MSEPTGIRRYTLRAIHEWNSANGKVEFVLAADHVREVEEVQAQKDFLAKILAEEEALSLSLEQQLATLKGQYQELVKFFDKHNGTPCEQIRHQQEVEELKEQLATALPFMQHMPECRYDEACTCGYNRLVEQAQRAAP